MNPYQYNPDRLSDSHFEKGSLERLVIGNECRLLDYRRTPLRVRELREAAGLVILEILDLEDKGNTWDIPIEDIAGFQFALDSRRADPEAVARYAAIADRLDRPAAVTCDEGAWYATVADLAEAEQAAVEWIRLRSTALHAGVRPDFSRPMGIEGLYADIEAYMSHHGLAHIEAIFAAHYVGKFHYSEFVKAHRITIAEMGLVPYEGKVLRDESALQGEFARARRREHVIRRMAFVRAIYRGLGISSLLLYGEVHSRGLVEPSRNKTFVSTTTNVQIAEDVACFREPSNPNKDGYRVGVLMSQNVLLNRVFMTYMETSQMNHPYRESEVVLLHDPGQAF